ncbi:MAG: DUF6252 family protein [candidate division WOR-3 bacterium]
MTPIISALLLIGSIISLESCDLFEKDQKPKTELEKLPPETQEGKNTFGCLVDGKAWVTKTSIDAQAFYQEGVFAMGAFLKGNNLDQGMSFYIYDLNLSIKEYSLTDNTDQYANFGDNILKCGFKTTSAYSGTLIITNIDNVKFIISGIFEFEAYSPECDKIVKITNGRFDLNFAP